MTRVHPVRRQGTTDTEIELASPAVYRRWTDDQIERPTETAVVDRELSGAVPKVSPDRPGSQPVADPYAADFDDSFGLLERSMAKRIRAATAVGRKRFPTALYDEETELAVSRRRPNSARGLQPAAAADGLTTTKTTSDNRDGIVNGRDVDDDLPDELRQEEQEEDKDDFTAGLPPYTMSNLSATPKPLIATIQRSDKVAVKVRIVFLKVGEIDSQKDRFAADVFVQARWREPAMDGKLHLAKNRETVNWEDYWTPRLSIQNGFGELKEMAWSSVSFDGNGSATVTEKRRVNGSFTEYMELNQFPFDSQDLTVTVTSDWSESEVELVEDEDRCILNADSFVDAQEWRLYSYIRVWNSTREDESKHDVVYHPSFSAACKASRKPQFFLWNIFVVMFMICSLSFATFVISSDYPQFRLMSTLILLLTTVSFKFAVNQSLPMISYLTYLDKYILGLMGLLSCICVWHAIIGKLVTNCYLFDPPSSSYNYCRDELYSTYDSVALAVLGTVYIGFHIAFIVLVACLEYEKNKENDQFADVQSINIGSSTVVRDREGEEPSFLPDLRRHRDAYAADATNQNVLVAA